MGWGQGGAVGGLEGQPLRVLRVGLLSSHACYREVEHSTKEEGLTGFQAPSKADRVPVDDCPSLPCYILLSVLIQ